MDKASLAVSIISAVVAYFSMNKESRIELKIFAVWCCLAVLICSHIHSLYLLGVSDEPISLIRILTLNVAALGVLVLLVTAVFLKKYLRESLETKGPRS